MKTMMAIVAALCCALSGNLEAQSDPVRVYIFTSQPSGGFTDTQTEWRTEAVRRAIDRIKKNKAVAIVETRQAAQVVVEVLDVTEAESDTTRSTYVGLGVGVSKRNRPEFRVHATVTAGEYSSPITTQDKKLQTAGRLVGDELNDWVKANRERLVGR